MSRYTNGGTLYKINNRDSYWERTIIPSSPQDVTITLEAKYHNAPDLLAEDLYGNSSLEWIILQFNNIQDVAVEFVAGKTIRLPSLNTVRGYL